MPYCGEVSTSTNVDCIGELVDGLRPGWLRSPQNVNASPLPCNRAGTSPLRALVAKAPVALRYAPQKIGIAASCLICFLAGLLPWLRLRTVLRASCPSDARGMNRHRELGCIGTVANHSNSVPSITCPRSSTRFLIIPARAPPPLGGTRYARSDTIRTPLLFFHWRIT
jgi:hypothetical protein